MHMYTTLTHIGWEFQYTSVYTSMVGHTEYCPTCVGVNTNFNSDNSYKNHIIILSKFSDARCKAIYLNNHHITVQSSIPVQLDACLTWIIQSTVLYKNPYLECDPRLLDYT